MKKTPLRLPPDIIDDLRAVALSDPWITGRELWEDLTKAGWTLSVRTVQSYLYNPVEGTRTKPLPSRPGPPKGKYLGKGVLGAYPSSSSRA